jgi:uncharacterized membrane protein
MERLKSIDTLRGLSMAWMFLGHLQNWWLSEKDFWVYDLTFCIMDVIGASAFLFIAGVSTAISYNNKYEKANSSENYNLRILKIEYFFKSLSILIIALLYNLIFAFGTNNLLNIWTWFVLLTMAISLFLAWPLLRTSKIFRISLGMIIWIVNQFLYRFIMPYKGQGTYGVLYHLLYNTPDLDPILYFFPFFLYGTVLGDVIHKIYTIENQEQRSLTIKNSLIKPLFLIGFILIIGGILFQFPMFLSHRTFPWMFYSLGIQLTLFSFLITGEEFIFKKVKRDYRFLFYFSYYSLSVYLIHNLLYFLFYRQLNAVNIWIYVIITFIIIGLVLRFMYNIWPGPKFSLKFQLGRFCLGIAERLDAKIIVKKNIHFRASPAFISTESKSKFIN